MARVFLTRSALRHIDGIRSDSEEQWGSDVAEADLADIEPALGRLAAHPHILQARPDIAPHLRFLPVRSHVIVADTWRDVVVVVGLWHGSVDIAAQLARFQPEFADEVRRVAERPPRSERGDRGWGSSQVETARARSRARREPPPARRDVRCGRAPFAPDGTSSSARRRLRPRGAPPV